MKRIILTQKGEGVIAMDADHKQKLKFKKYAWMTLMGFSLVYGFVYNGRFNMEYALPFIAKEFNWSKIEIGVVASVFYWTYAFGNFINGRLAEILGCKRFIMLGILLSVMANLIVSTSSSLMIIIILWGANGFFQSMIWGPGMSLIARWWPSRKRGFAAGIADGFSGLSHIALWYSILFTGWFMPQWGWRGYFIIPVLLLLLLSIFYWFMSKENPIDVGIFDYQEDDEEIRIREQKYKIFNLEEGKLFPYKCLFSQWRFCVWCLISALASISRYGLLTWIPLYYVAKMNIQVNTGTFSTLVLPIGMAMGTFIVPWLTDRFFRKNRAAAIIICGALSALMVFIFPSMTTVLTAAIAIFWSGFFIYGINGVIWAYSIDIGTRVFAGTAAGILNWAAYIGAGVQTVLFAYIFTRTNNWVYVFATIAIICILIVILAIIVNEENLLVYEDK